MREKNHAHSTATSVHSNRLTVSMKDFLEKSICEVKFNLMDYSCHENQNLGDMMNASAKFCSARGESCSPASFHSTSFFSSVYPVYLVDELVLIGVLYHIMLIMVLLTFRLT